MRLIGLKLISTTHKIWDKIDVIHKWVAQSKRSKKLQVYESKYIHYLCNFPNPLKTEGHTTIILQTHSDFGFLFDKKIVNWEEKCSEILGEKCVVSFWRSMEEDERLNYFCMTIQKDDV